MRKLILCGALLTGFVLFNGNSVNAGFSPDSHGGSHGSHTGHSSSNTSMKGSSSGSRPSTEHGKISSAKAGGPVVNKTGSGSSMSSQGQQNHSKPSSQSADNHGQHPSKSDSYPKSGSQVGGHDTKVEQHASRISRRFQDGKLPYGKSYLGKDGKQHRYDHCPANLQYCSKPASYHNWSKSCWFPKYGCNGYWCTESNSWYYWCEPRCCYLPASYIEEYPSVEPVDCVETDAPICNKQVVVDAEPCPVPVVNCPPAACETPCYSAPSAPCYKTAYADHAALSRNFQPPRPGVHDLNRAEDS
jgi:hypothetical protein